MAYFITYNDDQNKEHALKFFTDVLLFKWLGAWMAEKGAYPRNLCIYKAECVFDGS